MAICAGGGGINVCDCLAPRRGAVVAGRASTSDLGVIDTRDGFECHSIVAALAGRGRQDMRRRFALGGRAVMAGGATRCNACVVKF